MFVPGKHFQPILLFAVKARSLTKSKAAKRCFTQVGSGLNSTYKTWLEIPAVDKRSSLLLKFYNIEPIMERRKLDSYRNYKHQTKLKKSVTNALAY